MPKVHSTLLFCLLLLFLYPSFLFGQYYDLGQDPASVKWRQIRTPQFQIIYPDAFETQAQKMVTTLEYMYSNGTKTLAYKPQRIPLIVHSSNIVPNAITAWAPKRIELFPCPPQDSYAESWMNQLIVHEYRHVAQFDRANQGFTKVLSWFIGQQAASVVNGAFVPTWFMEGDAVCSETALSQSGRGRLPSFEMLLRTQIMQKGAFGYDKAAMGSYKTFVPNHYSLGYALVANVRKRYGYQAWVSALDEVARRPFRITPFNYGLKKATGFGKEKLYKMTMAEMDTLWKYQDMETTKSTFTQISTINSKKYINCKFPYYYNDTLVVTEQSSLDDIIRFKTIGPDGYQKVVTTPGFLSSENYSVFVPEQKGASNQSAFMLAWTETIDDIRWGQRNYSVIRIFNSSTGRVNNVTHKSRYFAPAFSADGKTLAAVSVDQVNNCAIVLINVETGKETDTLLRSSVDFYMTPSWSADGTKIVFTKLDSRGKSIQIFDLNTQIITTVIPPTFVEIANPVFANKYVLFNGSYSGIENIYAADMDGRQVFQITSAAFGACNADLSPNGSKLVYSNYTSSGYSLVETDFKPESWKQLDSIKDYSPSLYKHLVKEESGERLPEQINQKLYVSQPYRKNQHIFNFHSWAPAYVNYMSEENGLGVSFMSQNDLSTATAIVGYKYDRVEKTGKVTADFSWKAWYPIVELKSSYGLRAAISDSIGRYTFSETSVSGGVSIPLLFTGGKYYKGMQLSLHSSWKGISNNTSPLQDKLTGTIHSMDYSLHLFRYIKKSAKDVYPRWGQTMSLSYRHTPLGSLDLGSIVSAVSRFYFPGIMKHHSIRMDISWQQRNPKKYIYGNQIVYPRGYIVLNEKNMKLYSFNYKFPFLYPDLPVGPLVYIKRLKANLFYDGGVVSTNTRTRNVQSMGVELTSDLHFLRFVFPFDIGLRVGYRPIEKSFFNDFLFSVNLPN